MIRNDYYAINLDGEIVILDLRSNCFHFLDKEQTVAMDNYVNGSSTFDSKLDDYTFLFDKSLKSSNIIKYDDIEGIDNYSWSDVSHFINKDVQDINIKDKIFIVIIYFILFTGKDYFFKQKINLLKFLKKNTKVVNNNLDYVNSAANFIHHISSRLPFNLKCLENSLILAYFLTFKKYNFNLKIGVQKYDFLSHAWIEVDDIVVSDMPDLSKKLAIILAI
ncbi:lasso peptide biosynthesis B2 protein [Acinetobacter seifertii]|uniref:Lasso peptide biosynthesis B2 protein n=1 Tax=Acinetobacter seifertii TaxID=1530123 RepID=A0A7H2TB35_9GAMM|nr:lasso peptide biosynthesis B2 protein [Acinetobacter seifertii]QNX49068.1 lasso peptide biosynthesis B2 protein [Acinetobacter seifertii]QNY17506.1 lasso peptide biosynthesis B2 protein [Acinetobacter seifertii]